MNELENVMKNFEKEADNPASIFYGINTVRDSINTKKEEYYLNKTTNKIFLTILRISKIDD